LPINFAVAFFCSTIDKRGVVFHCADHISISECTEGQAFSESREIAPPEVQCVFSFDRVIEVISVYIDVNGLALWHCHAGNINKVSYVR